MRKLRLRVVLSLLGVGLILASCSNEEDNVVQDEQQEIPQEIIDQLSSFAINTKNLQRQSYEIPGGGTLDRIVAEGDIAFDPSTIASLSLYGGIQEEQYRTFNLVSSPRTLTVIGYTGGGGFGLSNSMRTGLQWAINNYNRLNLELNFQLSFAASTNADIVVFRQRSQPGAGGVAGFPSGGDPNKFVQLFTGLDNVDPNVNEHVAGHEIGHSIGFRHTDWFSRQSCGETGESAGSVGAVHIPGTPTGFDPTSIMLACFTFGTDGEFNQNDITAMNFLY
ncbi:peptidase [Leptobacterium flavescens]|uniref:Peptidase n=1 Tax=Leptobacterium flavescens TaxID=472055 RepID=A0A6P0UY15_9FLAO|nr:M57 family metalloprotease [Leptobacterium flavescens]NER15336.1 peptidase [Leptobacterium flavescens]